MTKPTISYLQLDLLKRENHKSWALFLALVKIHEESKVPVEPGTNQPADRQHQQTIVFIYTYHSIALILKNGIYTEFFDLVANNNLI